MPTPDVSTNTQIDLGHQHKHLHGDPHQHDHGHQDGFVGAHSHEHQHEHRHFEPPHGGQLIHLRRSPPDGTAESDSKADLETLLHLEAVASTDELHVYSIVESEDGSFQTVELATESVVVRLAIGDFRWQGELRKSGNQGVYRAEFPEALRSELRAVGSKNPLVIESVSIGDYSSTQPEEFAVQTAALDPALD